MTDELSNMTKKCPDVAGTENIEENCCNHCETSSMILGSLDYTLGVTSHDEMTC